MPPSRKYIKTKYRGVYYRLSSRRDPRTGEPDRIYCFWYADCAGKGHWQVVGRHSKGERPQTAFHVRATYLSQVKDGGNPVEREIFTIGMAVDAYVIWAQGENKHVNTPLAQYDKHMRARLHAVPISAVTASMLSAIKAELLRTIAERPRPKTPPKSYVPPPERTLSPQTVAHLFSFARRAINHAIGSQAWSGVNPLASAPGPGGWKMPKVDNARLKFFTQNEANLLLEALRTSSRQLHDMSLLSLKTGLRAPEIFRLRAQDVDQTAKVLHVTAKGGRREIVHATDDVIAMLLSYGRTGTGYIFTSRKDGERIKSTSSTFGRIVRKLGLNASDGDPRYAITFHTWRHTFASWLAQSGKVTLLELQKLMRHETLAMTQRYAHLIPGQERKRLSIIDDMLTKAEEHD